MIELDEIEVLDLINLYSQEKDKDLAEKDSGGLIRGLIKAEIALLLVRLVKDCSKIK